MRELSREQAGARRGQARELHELPRAARGRPGQGMHHLSRRREGRAPATVGGGWSGSRMCGLSSSAQPRRGTAGRHLRELSRQTAPRDREVPRLPRPTRGQARDVGGAVRELSRREDPDHRVERASRLRGLPRASGSHTVDTGPVVRNVPRTDRGEHQSRPWRVRELPHQWRTRTAASAASLRVVSQVRGDVGAEGASSMHDMPRAPQRQGPRDSDVRELSCRAGERWQAHRVCELSSPSRPNWNREAAGVRDLPCTGEPTGASPRRGPRYVRGLPSIA